jgi:hypothetical protein
LMDPPDGAPASTTRGVGDRLHAMGDDIRQDFRTGFSRSQQSEPPTPTLPRKGGGRSLEGGDPMAAGRRGCGLGSS